jgi:hypothetical protein
MPSPELLLSDDAALLGPRPPPCGQESYPAPGQVTGTLPDALRYPSDARWMIILSTRTLCPWEDFATQVGPAIEPPPYRFASEDGNTDCTTCKLCNAHYGKRCGTAGPITPPQAFLRGPSVSSRACGVCRACWCIRWPTNSAMPTRVKAGGTSPYSHGMDWRIPGCWACRQSLLRDPRNH